MDRPAAWMRRPHRPSAVLPAVLAVALPLVGTPVAVTAGVLLGDAVHRAVPSVTVPSPGLPGIVTGLLVRQFGHARGPDDAGTYAR
ncbi:MULTISPECIES: hypothetical protein [Kitasatospora]|uniref:SLC26A/SulP transporter domain-containing protein n=1 Tax=Kitasatospora cathayae TaxID=3004092 RepID=A0ABY7Q4Z1_9ACTN|nr:hypothetical protein [Kitasatospora sp. HUAS 3-15]WBP87592.1 hypothetical protein O1G21_18265 [Kitasatospora sp. HUAS 3-15]